MRLTFLVLLTILNTFSCFSQIKDDFSSEDFSLWSGDTSSFIINPDHQLQLNAASEASTKSIFTESKVINDAVWMFDVHLLFNPSSNNNVNVYLVSDQSDITQTNGYFVRIGDTEDEISLFKISNGISTKIIDGLDDRVDFSNVIVRIKVVRDHNGKWELHSDVDISGEFIKEGETIENTFTSSAFFIIQCNYTSTRSDKFIFDNIDISGTANNDQISPHIAETNVLNENTISIRFSEKVNYSQEMFLENCRYQQPNNILADNDSLLTISFSNVFPENQICELIVTGIEDKAQNELPDTTISFQYIPPVQPDLNEILITEIMADPTPNVELPEEEYIEIYNASDEDFTIKEMYLFIRRTKVLLPDFQLKADSFLIITGHSNTEDFSSYGPALGVTNWKALLNGGDTISLMNRYDQLVFQLIYQKAWYKDSDKANGGYSLEMIDTHNPCGTESNWIASIDKSGGTPGIKNSVAANNPDLSKPYIKKLAPINSHEIALEFSEQIVNSTLSTSNFSILPSITISSLNIPSTLFSTMGLHITEPLQQKVEYVLQYKEIHDCAGNTSGVQKINFVLPEEADSLDIIFNEIMYDPVESGSEYIEIMNRSAKNIDLQNWKIVSIENGSIKSQTTLSNEHKIIRPNDILVFTKNQDVLIGQFPNSRHDRIMECDLFPLTNEEGNLILTPEKGGTIDQLSYTDQFHHVLIDNTKGISLERIKNDLSSTSEEIWQSASATMGGGTPTLPNSHLIYEKSASKLSISPKVFAPDNDGYRDFASVQYSIDQPGTLASIYVFDLSGRLIKTLVNHENIPSEGLVVWEGENENGMQASFGNYIVLMELTTPEGNHETLKETVAIVSKF